MIYLVILACFSCSALYSSFLGIVVVYILLVIDALVIYALYKDCDLLMSGRVSQNDQVRLRNLEIPKSTPLFLLSNSNNTDGEN